jgi:hypothetical protein
VERDQFLLEAINRNRTRKRMELGEREEREWYVRLENLYLNDSFMGYKRIITRSDLLSDVIDTIIRYYGIPSEMRHHMKLYSNPFRSRRLDMMEHIPKEFEFVHIYFF